MSLWQNYGAPRFLGLVGLNIPTIFYPPQNTYLFLCMPLRGRYGCVIVANVNICYNNTTITQPECPKFCAEQYSHNTGDVAVQRAPVLLSNTTTNIAKKSGWGIFKPTLMPWARSTNIAKPSPQGAVLRNNWRGGGFWFHLWRVKGAAGSPDFFLRTWNKDEFFFVAEFWSAAPIIDFVTIQAS